MQQGAAMSRSSSKSMKLSVIGGFHLSACGEPVELADPARRVVAFLAVRSSRWPRAVVAATLWPDKPDSRARANLRSALWALHAAERSPVESCGDTLRLHDDVWVDIESVRTEAWTLIERAHSDALVTVDEALGSELAADGGVLFQDLLPGWYDEWVLVEQERFGELQVHALDVLVEALVGGGCYAHGLNLARRLVAVDPLRERSQLALIRAYAAEGSFGRARSQHRTFSELMESAFGRGYDRSFEEVCEATPPGRRLANRTDTRALLPGLQVGVVRDETTMS
jgi:DNA-binding SARP family transcriptional activator